MIDCPEIINHYIRQCLNSKNTFAGAVPYAHESCSSSTFPLLIQLDSLKLFC